VPGYPTRAVSQHSFVSSEEEEEEEEKLDSEEEEEKEEKLDSFCTRGGDSTFLLDTRSRPRRGSSP
jgi:hypothetical protein